MKQWRAWLVMILAGVIIAGHLFDIVTQTEHWPFSFYPMYRRAQKKPELALLEMYAIPPGKRPQALRLVGTYVPPLSDTAMRNILMGAWGRDQSVNKTAEILREYMRLYESRRVAGLHDGLPIVELQLCRATWIVSGPRASDKPRKIERLLGVRAGGQIVRYENPPATRAVSSLATP